jgi:MoaA/NifB/PqqE/SkfB family radical SAM enzyme
VQSTGILRAADSRGYVGPLNRGLRVFFSEFVRVSLTSPGRAWYFLKVLAWQVQSARLRARWARTGLHVPPIAIFSITNRCNLHCKGCYAQAIRDGAPDELGSADLRRIISEGAALGISFFVIAGGEPLTRPEILDITRQFPRVVFLLITNGLLLDGALIAGLRRQRNTVPVLSIEGSRAQTDERRGRGVHERLRARMSELRRAGVFFSLSFTVTRANFETVTDERFVRGAIQEGCRLFFFLEYTPIRSGTDEWVITDEQRQRMKTIVRFFRSSRRFPAVFVAVPWDEEQTGGCLAAGRGFVHISATGDLEPCPFVPYSDTSLKDKPLREALASRFLLALRANHEDFAETEGGCSLWRHREKLRGLLASQVSRQPPGRTLRETPAAS